MKPVLREDGTSIPNLWRGVCKPSNQYSNKWLLGNFGNFNFNKYDKEVAILRWYYMASYAVFPETYWFQKENFVQVNQRDNSAAPATTL